MALATLATPPLRANDKEPEVSPPLYPASPIGAVTLNYHLHRGPLSGEGRLEWRPRGTHYSLSLTGLVAGFRVLHQQSEGTLNPHGLAPQQFSDRRMRSQAQTATLLSEQRLIRYSNAADAVWLPGTQDRLSWMIQLPAILHRMPSTTSPGQRIALYVTGARGDADLWRFRFSSTETIHTPAGPIISQKWVREPRREHDSSVEVWLDPSRDHLPIRAKLGSTEGEALELLLRDITPYP